MDYSPSPARVNPEYAFLDNSIELGRAERTKVSPLKEQDHLNNLQRRFLSKYPDFRPSDQIRSKKIVQDDTTDRLFKNMASVPVNDGVKISSNMVEKIIRENERLKSEKELVQGFAKGLKEKLIKYKQLNDSLKEDLNKSSEKVTQLQQDETRLKGELADLQLKYDALEKQQVNQNRVPEFNFNPENTRDIFGTPLKSISIDESNSSSTKIEQRIQQLEEQVSQIRDKDDERFEYIKQEMNFLKTLITQEEKIPTPPESPREMSKESPREPLEDTSIRSRACQPQRITEDSWVLRETEELNELQSEVSKVQYKLQLREENLKKKNELKRQLKQLSAQLEMNDEVQELNGVNDVNEVADKDERHQSTKQQCDVCPPRNVNDIEQEQEEPHFHINGTKWY
jgi:DNA repair exonuclease SbcCD ATPase subunit